MRMVVALIAGLIFGLGLVISDMINPGRVLGFLDLFGGSWDPTLAFVMLGALLVMGLAWGLAGARQEPILGGNLPGPASTTIDGRLIGGAVLFGLGWGLVGLCPGPALAGLLVGGIPILVFVIAMITGMAAFSLARKA